MLNLWEHFPTRDEALRMFAETLKEEAAGWISETLAALHEEREKARADYAKKETDYRLCLDEKIKVKEELQRTRDELEQVRIELRSRETLGPDGSLTDREREELVALRKAAMVCELEKRKLEDRLGVLEEENRGFRESIQSAKIAAALEESADKYKVRSEARRDIRRLASELKVDETGAVVTKDNLPLALFFASEIEASPHWLPASRGGGSTGGSTGPTADTLRKESYSKAKETVLRAGNGREARAGVLEMIRNAPVK